MNTASWCAVIAQENISCEPNMFAFVYTIPMTFYVLHVFNGMKKRFFCAANRIRTCNLPTLNGTLCQLDYSCIAVNNNMVDLKGFEPFSVGASAALLLPKRINQTHLDLLGVEPKSTSHSNHTILRDLLHCLYSTKTPVEQLSG